MRRVVALGGHALVKPGQVSGGCDPDAIAGAARAIAEHLHEGALIVTHGNGPLAGWLATQSELVLGPQPGFDAITAQTEGLTGYSLDLALSNEFRDRDVTALLTQVEIDADDPELARPSKPIGRVYDDEEADCLRARGFAVGADRNGFRRIVPSPRPLRVLEERAIDRLLGPDDIVICGGGGGIPVHRRADGSLVGADGIVDKDFTSALLGIALGARELFLLTDVGGVHPAWPDASVRLSSADPDEIERGTWSAGSIGPKVEAAARFARETGGTAWIGRCEDLGAILEGEAGTRIRVGAPWVEEKC